MKENKEIEYVSDMKGYVEVDISVREAFDKYGLNDFILSKDGKHIELDYADFRDHKDFITKQVEILMNIKADEDGVFNFTRDDTIDNLDIVNRYLSTLGITHGINKLVASSFFHGYQVFVEDILIEICKEHGDPDISYRYVGSEKQYFTSGYDDFKVFVES